MKKQWGLRKREYNSCAKNPILKDIFKKIYCVQVLPHGVARYSYTYNDSRN